MIRKMFRPLPIPLALFLLVATGMMKGSAFLFLLAIYMVAKYLGRREKSKRLLPSTSSRRATLMPIVIIG